MNPRMDRIEWLLKELRHEVHRGMMEHEIEESLGFNFIIPVSASIPEGVVVCEFRTRPMHRHCVYLRGDDLKPRLQVVK
jgi:hypothetical protein